MNLGLLAIAPDGSYARVNGFYIEPLGLRAVSAAIQKLQRKMFNQKLQQKMLNRQRLHLVPNSVAELSEEILHGVLPLKVPQPSQLASKAKPLIVVRKHRRIERPEQAPSGTCNLDNQSKKMSGNFTERWDRE